DVYEATHIKTQTKWAIKEVRRPAAGSSRVVMVDNEIDILKRVNHAHIIHLEAVYRTPTKLYLVTELCKGGDLRQLLQKKNFFTEDETRNIICSLADAVVYLHKRVIAHRDLKLENILVKNSLKQDGDSINIKISVPHEESCVSVHLCDVWSIGVVMYMLLCGEPPFASKTKALLLQEIMNNGVRFTQPIWDTVSDAAKHLLTCLLKVEPAFRMTANQLRESPWITGDTNAPAAPSNMLEMMQNYMEQEESNTDYLNPPCHDLIFSIKISVNCSCNAKLRPERSSSSRASSASTKLVLHVCLPHSPVIV
uniref:Serine/threonine kinase 33 n=1 Tax=Stegastes partitus TaxID=144197 RepID=A0A3B5AQI2_9TELE